MNPFKPLQMLYQDFKVESPPNPVRLFEVLERIDQNLIQVYNSITTIQNTPVSSLKASPVYAEALNASTVSIVANDTTPKALSFKDQTIADTANIHSLTTNPSRFTVPVTGMYMVNSEYIWEITSKPVTGVVSLYVNVNGVDPILNDNTREAMTFPELTALTSVGAADFYYLHQVGMVYLQKGDYIEFIFRYTTAASGHQVPADFFEGGSHGAIALIGTNFV